MSKEADEKLRLELESRARELLAELSGLLDIAENGVPWQRGRHNGGIQGAAHGAGGAAEGNRSSPGEQ